MIHASDGDDLAPKPPTCSSFDMIFSVIRVTYVCATSPVELMMLLADLHPDSVKDAAKTSRC
jgi:hypothetical protein